MSALMYNLPPVAFTLFHPLARLLMSHMGSRNRAWFRRRLGSAMPPDHPDHVCHGSVDTGLLLRRVKSLES